MMHATWQTEFLRQLPAETPALWRDLAWLLSSPDLLKQVQLQAPDLAPDNAYAALQSFLQQQRSDLTELLSVAGQDTALAEFVRQRGARRLGLYAEQLLDYFFARQGNLLAHGLQVRRAKTTLGEFDFLLRAGTIGLHMELACKYYLCVPAAERDLTLFDYLGPNLADSLGAKLRKIASQQLQLSREPEAQTILQEFATQHGLNNWLAFSHIKGCLFYRYGQALPVLPDELAVDHARGLILELDELSEIQFDAAICLHRLDWLAPRTWSASQIDTPAQVRQNLQRLWQIQATPQMLSLLAADGSQWREVTRAFVMPPGWWQRASELTLAQRSNPVRQ